jgi:hypothetical protein
LKIKQIITLMYIFIPAICYLILSIYGIHQIDLVVGTSNFINIYYWWTTTINYFAIITIILTYLIGLVVYNSCNKQ